MGTDEIGVSWLLNHGLSCVLNWLFRYIAICHPFKNIHFRTKSSRVILTIIVSWILAVTAAAPIGLEFGILRFPYPNDTWAAEVAGEPILESSVCTAPPEGAMSILVQFSTFVFFLLPMVVIIFLHIIIAVHLRRSTYMTRIAASSENIHNHHNNGGKSSQPQQGRQSVLKMLGKSTNIFSACGWAVSVVFLAYSFRCGRRNETCLE